MEGILRIKELLQERNMTSKAFAKKIEMAPVALSNIVNEKKNTSLNTLKKIALALDVEVKDLFVSASEEPIYIKKGEGFERIGSIKGKQ